VNDIAPSEVTAADTGDPEGNAPDTAVTNAAAVVPLRVTVTAVVKVAELAVLYWIVNELPLIKVGAVSSPTTMVGPDTNRSNTFKVKVLLNPLVTGSGLTLESV
jgi:hypothetical protein